MNPLTREWIGKAEEDYEAAQRLSRTRKISLWNAVCFHAQQCAEKYLKACLQEDGIDIPKIHHLPALLDKLLVNAPLWEPMRPGLILLTSFAVEFRYPGESATREDAKGAIMICRHVRMMAREKLCGEQPRTRQRSQHKRR